QPPEPQRSTAPLARKLIAFLCVFRQQSDGRIRAFARSTPSSGRQRQGGALLPDRIVEVQQRQQEIGPIPTLARPIASTVRQPGIERSSQLRIIESTRRERRSHLLRG